MRPATSSQSPSRKDIHMQGQAPELFKNAKSSAPPKKVNNFLSTEVPTSDTASRHSLTHSEQLDNSSTNCNALATQKDTEPKAGTQQQALTNRNSQKPKPHNQSTPQQPPQRLTQQPGKGQNLQSTPSNQRAAS